VGGGRTGGRGDALGDIFGAVGRRGGADLEDRSSFYGYLFRGGNGGGADGVLKGGGGGPLVEGVSERIPGLVERTGVIGVAGAPTESAAIGRRIGIDGLEDIGEVDFGGRAGEDEATAEAFLGREKSGDDEAAEDFGEVMSGDTGAEGDILSTDGGDGGFIGEPGHGAEGVFGSLGEGRMHDGDDGESPEV
jgi:hypothetical protein